MRALLVFLVLLSVPAYSDEVYFFGYENGTRFVACPSIESVYERLKDVEDENTINYRLERNWHQKDLCRLFVNEPHAYDVRSGTMLGMNSHGAGLLGFVGLLQTEKYVVQVQRIYIPAYRQYFYQPTYLFKKRNWHFVPGCVLDPRDDLDRPRSGMVGIFSPSTSLCGPRTQEELASFMSLFGQGHDKDQETVNRLCRKLKNKGGKDLACN